jgi:hypothetical protein
MNFQRKRAENKDQITLENICLNGLLITVLFFLNKLGVPGSAICYAILFMISIHSLEGAIKAISLSGLIIMASPFLIDINEIHTFFRFPLIAVAGARIFWEVSHRRIVLFAEVHIKTLLAFGIVSLFLAFLNQYFFVISFLKLGTFIYGTCAIMLAANINRLSGKTLSDWFFSLVLFYIAANILAYVLGIGYTFRRGLYEFIGDPAIGYVGMTSHPQVQGTLSAISFAYAFSIYLFTSYRLRWLMGLAAPILLILCYMSASRTGLFAAMGTIILAIAVTATMNTGSRRVRMNVSTAQIVTTTFMGIISLIALEAITGGAILQKVSDFSVKAIRSGNDFSFDRIYETRIHLIEISWQNFIQNPSTGIGFGTMLNAQWAANASILAAPTEKGFLPTAILEEVGIPGTFCFILFLLAFFYHYWRLHNIVALTMMTCFLLLNLGEMVFFALGGSSLYCWAMIGAGIATGNRVLEKT